MPQPPPPITHRASAGGGRFARQNGSNGGPAGGPPTPPRRKPKLKKLRFAVILLGLSVLAFISTMFGMLMAVASDLPSLENKAEYRASRNSNLYSDGPGCKNLRVSCQIAKLTGNDNRILLEEGEISPNIKNAVIAVEDRRFYEHEGVDYTGIGRALVQDVMQRRAAQGGSTITQQFVKNALSAQGDRSVFQKLRESALAYNLERKWPKEKILTHYLNTVYFGNGAYGIEAAVRTYFGDGDDGSEDQDATTSGVEYAAPEPIEEDDPNRREAIDVTPEQAALLAGMISSPSLYDPLQNPKNATARRNLVLSRMVDQGYITRGQYEEAVRQAIPDEDEVDRPDSESEQPYFTSWMTQQLVDRYGAGQVFGGGLKVKTTIDPEIQSAAENAVAGRLAGVGPDSSMVVIENKTAEVKAMVGGSNFDARPFNLATNGHRQPGSSFKPFILVRALADGVDPNSVWASQQKIFPVPNSPGEKFVVNNYEDSYLGSASLWSATATSDNSVYAELGIDVGTERVARMANRMGIRTELSTNPAMTLGGLEEGVTPLEMAYAYSTIANEGTRVSGTLAPSESGPVAFEEVEDPRGGLTRTNERVEERVFPESVGQTAKDMLGLVVSSGTGENAQVPGETIWGKTGTTENYGDAWFVGGNDDLTVATWVGYADTVKPMEYEYSGGPVAGGTFPADIFRDFMTSWVQMRDQREAEQAAARGGDDVEEDDATGGELYTPSAPVDPTQVPSDEQQAPAPEDAVPDTGAPDDGGGGDATPAPMAPTEPAPAPPAPEPTPAPTPAPAPTPPPSTGGDSGGVGAAPPG